MTGVLGEGRRFTATVPDKPGDMRVEVDGIDITRTLASFSVDTDSAPAGANAIVELRLALVGQMDLDLQRATVVLSADQVELLMAAGWRHPIDGDRLDWLVSMAVEWAHGKASGQDLLHAVQRYQTGGLTDAGP